MNIAFRVDSSDKIGTGHVKRCLNLAKQLRKRGNQINFFCQDLNGNLVKEIKKNKFNVEVIKNKFNKSEKKILSNHFLTWSRNMQKKDINFFKRKNKKFDLLIVDHYGLNYLWEQDAKYLTKKIFVIDDLKKNTHYCDIYLNYHHNFFKKEDEKILIKKGVKILKGLNFTLLGNELNKIKKKISKRRDKFKIFLYMGNVDKNNITLKILQLLNNNLFFKYKIIIIIGLNNPKKVLIEKYLKNFKNIKIVKKYNINLKTIYDKVNFTISAAGVTMYEQLYYGFKPIIFPQNKSQLEVSTPLNKSNYIYKINANNKNARKNLLKILKSNKSFLKKDKINAINKFITNGSKNIVEVINP